MTNTREHPGWRRFISSKQRSASRLGVISARFLTDSRQLSTVVNVSGSSSCMTRLACCITDAIREKFTGTVTEEPTVREPESEVLGKARLPGPKEARYPNTDAFVRLVWSLRVALENRVEM